MGSGTASVCSATFDNDCLTKNDDYYSYEERIDRVESRITARLRDQLGGARNANEMFVIFSRFNALFIRPHIRGAIREYQTQLIQRVKEDIESLQHQFTTKNVANDVGESGANRMGDVRDIPPVSGSIIWIRQVCLHILIVLLDFGRGQSLDLY